MKLLLTAMAAAMAACSPTPAAQEQEAIPALSEAGLQQVPLTVASATGTHRFVVEVARTPQEQQRGMMFRQSVAPNRGMIFPYDPPQPVAFWMKNTLIPLDIIYVRADGTIAQITTATPQSLEAIPSSEPIALVLEIGGGRAAELGIKPGDRVSW